VVVGSGFEADTGLMARLARGRRLLGNSRETVDAVKDPARFFPLLGRLGVPHPETRLAPPPDPSGWLAKRRGGAGGTHVAPASATRHGRGGIEALAKAEIAGALDRIVAETGLVGLNGLDFIAHEQGWSAIEINPRPTASMEYYDADWPRGLLAVHIEACEGRLPAGLPPSRGVRGHAVVFAAGPVAVRPGLRFPEWCRDIPNPGTLIPAGGPVCTVHAEAADDESVRRLIRSRRSELQSLLVNEAAA
jgi:hypothetical protein